MNKVFCIVEIISKLNDFNKVRVNIKFSEKIFLDSEMILSKAALYTLARSKNGIKKNRLAVEGALCIKKNNRNVDTILLFANKCIPQA